MIFMLNRELLWSTLTWLAVRRSSDQTDEHLEVSDQRVQPLKRPVLVHPDVIHGLLLPVGGALLLSKEDSRS